MENIHLDYHVDITHWKPEGEVKHLCCHGAKSIHFDPPNFKAKVFMYVDVVPCKLGLDFTSSNRPFNEILQLGYLLWKSHKSCHQKYAN